MSRVGKAPIQVANGVKVAIAGRKIDMQGPKGKLSYQLPECLSLKQEGSELVLSRDEKKHKNAVALHGTTRAILANMMTGVNVGFTKELEIVGVGYRAAIKGKTLSLTIGFSHSVDYDLPEGVDCKVDKNTQLVLSSANRVLLGETAAKIRSFRPPEPYQGKGIKYNNEHIRRKQGKAAGAK